MRFLRRLMHFNQSQALLDRYALSTALVTDTGCCRLENEDCIHYSSLDKHRRNAIAIVADGMGGHAAGETASHEAVHSIQSHFTQQNYADDPVRSLKKAVTQANTHIYRLASHDPELSGMGTTVTALAIINGFAYYAHVGDSRLYLLRNGGLRQLTQDHTLVAQMLIDGLISQELAQTHPDRNIITRSIGTKPTVDVDVAKSPIPIHAGDIFVLCSDGLYELVTDFEIAKLILEHDPEDACHLLIEAARTAGGYDNISVIILAVQTALTEPLKPAITRF